jgi:raffinose/stachyose/melibiose transport system permease protein
MPLGPRLRSVRLPTFGTLAVLPAVIFMVAFIVVPAVVAVALSVTNWTGIGPIQQTVGLRNFTYLLQQGGFGAALKITVIYTIVVTILSTAFGYVLAALIHMRLRGWRIYKVSWFVPIVIPSTVTAILWSGAVFAHASGFLDSVSSALRLPAPPQGWLGDAPHALIAIIVTAIWASTGWPMLILSAAMERLPKDYFEAAILDGANWWQSTRRIVLPEMAPVISTVLTIQLVFGLKAFDVVFVMTGGGPDNATQTIGLLMYQAAFGNGQFGLGAATAVLMVIVIIPVALVQRRLSAMWHP